MGFYFIVVLYNLSINNQPIPIPIPLLPIKILSCGQKKIKMSEEKKLFLLDGHALIYRAHFAFISRPLLNSKGMNVGAITGFVRTLWEVISKQKPTHLAVAFDLSGPTFRHEMYEPYKANREAQPEDIRAAFPYVKKIIKGFNIPIVTKEGFEADDVIGTLAKQAEKEGFKVYMMTPDKDYAQLCSENVFMYKPARSGNDPEILDGAAICEKWGIQRVEQVIDVLGLQGDSVDNIPGVPGIGPKTAKKLLALYDSVEGLIANSDKLKGKQRENVETFTEQALLSKKLATIITDVPVTFDAKEYLVEEMNKEVLTPIFKELEFRALSRQILGINEDNGGQKDLFGNAVSPVKSRSTKKSIVGDKNIVNTPHEYHLADTAEKRAALIKLLGKQKEFCFDTETTGIDANDAELVGIAFTVKAGEAYYVNVPEDQEETKAIVQEFKSVLENKDIVKIGQNIKYDMTILKWYGVEVAGTLFDTMVAHYLCEPDLRHNLNFLAESYLNYSPVSIETIIGKKGKMQLSMRNASLDKIKEYAGEDSDITYQLKSEMEALVKEANLEKLYYEMEAPVIKVLVDMEYEGINLDGAFLENYSKDLAKEIQETEKAIYEEAEVQFNIGSPKQVGEILFDKMKIPYRWRKTSSGQYSTDEGKLTELAENHPFVAKILSYRGLAKLKSTYVDALPKQLNPKTGRIHSSFNQALAATGRLSSNNPNLQNIPIKTEAGRQVRKAFIPRDENHVLLAADYSQIELRIIAEISGDEAMVDAFQKNLDIHTATASKVYDVPYEEVTKEQRRNAKTVNFSIIYGAGSTNLSKQLGIKRKEAKALIEQYFTQYAGLKKYMDDTVNVARENGFVTTLMGRRRVLRDINSQNGFIRSNAERVAINTPIQGTAADMIKMAMIKVHTALKEGQFATKMILQVHDELVFDVPKSELEAVKPIIEKNMAEAITGLKVPILVGMDTGNNWLEAH